MRAIINHNIPAILSLIVIPNVIFITLPHAKYPYSWPVFASEPFLVEIGDDTRVSYNVSFVTHDGSVDIIRKFIDEDKRDNVLTIGKIKIGKNCLIGCNVTILPGVTIGDNAVIGAGSVVSKNIPEGEVWGGCPIKFIKKTTELAQKYLELNQTSEMDELKKEFKQGYERYIKAQ